MNTLDAYWTAVQQKVCKACCDGDGAGGCMLSRGQACALENSFEEIVNAVRSVKSYDVQPYTDAIRLGVCAFCKHQSVDGTCLIRAEVDCGLDRYLPLVIEAIEQVDAVRGEVAAAGITQQPLRGDES